MQKVSIFNSQTGKVEQHRPHIAKLKLKYNHVNDKERGGIFATEEEAKKMGLIKPVRKATKATAKTSGKAAPKPTSKGKKLTEFDIESMNIKDLKAMAVEKLGIDQDQAKGMKKDELIAALKG